MELMVYLGHVDPSWLIGLPGFFFFPLCCRVEKFIAKLTWDPKNVKGVLKTVPSLQMGYN